MTPKQTEVINKLNTAPEGFEIKRFDVEVEDGRVYVTREIGRPDDTGTILETAARHCSIFSIGVNGGIKKQEVY